MLFKLLVFDDEEEEFLFLFHGRTFLIQGSINCGICSFLSVICCSVFVYNWGWQERNQHCCQLLCYYISSICLVLGYQGVLPRIGNWIVVTEGVFSIAVTVDAVNQSSFFVCFLNQVLLVQIHFTRRSQQLSFSTSPAFFLPLLLAFSIQTTPAMPSVRKRQWYCKTIFSRYILN